MTPEEIDKLTIAEVRAICERAAAAMSELQRLGLMPTRVVRPEVDLSGAELAPVDEDPAAAHRRRQFQPVDDGGTPRRAPSHTHPGGGLSAAERAEKARIMGRSAPIDPNLPEDIQAAMGAE